MTRQRQRPLLRHRVELLASAIYEDDIGNQFTEWVTVARPWAAVEPLSGREYWAAAAVQAERTIKVILRYRPGVTPAHRLVFKGRVFDIESVVNIEESNRWLELKCKERVDEE